VLVASPNLPDPRGFGIAAYATQLPRRGDVHDPAYLGELLGHSNHDVAIPLAEDILETIWTLPDSMTRRVYPSTTARQRSLLRDRWALYDFAESLAIPIPGRATIGDRNALHRIISAWGFPLVLRGTQGLGGQQVRVASTREEAETALDYLTNASPGAPFAQEFIAGQRCLIGGLFDRGRMLQWFSQTTIESNYPPTGPSIRVKSLRDDVLTRLAQVLFEALEWNGLACAEFMRDGRGEYRFLEVNPRPWAAIQAAHVCGVPLMRSFAERMMGRSVDPQPMFPDGKEVTLFPQFLMHRLATGFGRWRDRRAYGQLMACAPMGQPNLLLHLLRQVWSSR
jgi:hypothetical protein